MVIMMFNREFFFFLLTLVACFLVFMGIPLSYQYSILKLKEALPPQSEETYASLFVISNSYLFYIESAFFERIVNHG